MRDRIVILALAALTVLASAGLAAVPAGAAGTATRTTW